MRISHACDMMRTREPPTPVPTMATTDPESQSKPPARPAQIPWMSLPNKDQLFLLALCRLSEPLSNTCLLPYIFYLMRSILSPDHQDGVTDDATARRISQYSGILVAAFPLAQFTTSMLWAKAADTYGRRSTIIWALLVSMLANAAFGFSRSFGGLLFWRTIAGIANGNVGVMRTMTAEIVQERKYQTKAFLLLPLIFNSGMVAGLALGGCLADPVHNLPFLFGATGIFNIGGHAHGVQWALAYPYALPALLNAAMLCTSLVLSFLWLRETLECRAENRIGLGIGRHLQQRIRRWLMRSRGYQQTPSASDTDSDDTEDEAKPMLKAQIRQLQPKNSGPVVWTKDVLIALISFGLLPLHNSAFMHVFPVFLSSSATNNRSASLFRFDGGLGMSSPTIGLWLGMLGTCGILLQLYIYPRLQERLGTLGTFRIALFIFPITYALAPYLSFLGNSRGCGKWLAIGTIAWLQVMARTIAIPSTVILLTNAAPSKPVLGRIHGAGNMLASLARAIGPAVGGVIYASGIDRHILGAVWWFYLMTVAFCALVWSYKMKDISV